MLVFFFLPALLKKISLKLTEWCTRCRRHLCFKSKIQNRDLSIIYSVYHSLSFLQFAYLLCSVWGFRDPSAVSQLFQVHQINEQARMSPTVKGLGLWEETNNTNTYGRRNRLQTERPFSSNHIYVPSPHISWFATLKHI